MKLLHLGDLHIGKKVNGFNMLNDQKFVLNQVYDVVRDENISGVLISGDIFDRPIPTIEALSLFEQFLTKLISFNISIYIISGNHDSSDRLAYLSDLLKKNNVFFSKSFDGKIERYSFNDEIEIYLLPFIYPSVVKKYFKGEKIDNYNDAVSVLINNTQIDKDKINIILVHQFVISSNNDEILSDSEEKTLGGLDWVDYRNFSLFDYAALGHLHSPQKIVLDKIRYSGSILKYSFSELNQKKRFTIIDIQDKNNIKTYFRDINFLRDFREYKGYIDDFLDENFYSNINKDDYIHFILLDENVIDAKKKLDTIYPNIMLLEFDNSFTKNINSDLNVVIQKNKTLAEHFSDFYKIQTGLDFTDEQQATINKLVEEAK